MKKSLLPIMMLAWASISIHAQQPGIGAWTSLSGQQPVLETGATAPSHAAQLLSTPWTQRQTSRVARTDEPPTGSLAYLLIDGADIPAAADGFASVPSIDAVLARMTAAKLKPYAGYTIVGIAFIVAGDLGEVPSLLAMERRSNGYHTVAGGNIEGYTVSSAEEGMVLNEVGVTQQYLIPDSPSDIIFGYSYTQQHTGTNADSPIFIGKTTDYTNGYLALGTLMAQYGRGIYQISSQEFPYALCVQLILQKGDATAIVGIDGTQPAQVVERYTADGKLLTAPTHGINIEKLADGTTRKVYRP